MSLGSATARNQNILQRPTGIGSGVSIPNALVSQPKTRWGNPVTVSNNKVLQLCIMDTNSISEPAPLETKPKDSYVKLAMRNMVRKSRQSLVHFGLTSLGLMGVLLGLAFLTHH